MASLLKDVGAAWLHTAAVEQARSEAVALLESIAQAYASLKESKAAEDHAATIRNAARTQESVALGQRIALLHDELFCAAVLKSTFAQTRAENAEQYEIITDQEEQIRLLREQLAAATRTARKAAVPAVMRPVAPLIVSRSGLAATPSATPMPVRPAFQVKSPRTPSLTAAVSSSPKSSTGQSVVTRSALMSRHHPLQP